MRRTIFFVIFLILLSFLSGCGGSTFEQNKTNDPEKPGSSDVKPGGNDSTKPGDKVGDCEKDCGDKAYCKDGACVSCGKEHACGSQCVDLSSSLENCGVCGKVCGMNMVCESGQCVCDFGYANVDKDDGNGCEQEVTDCIDGEKRSCWPEYFPDPVVGSSCKKGESVCSNGIWGECVGLVLPKAYDPSRSGEDLNCNGQPDGNEDLDKDGVSKLGGDCCDDFVQCPFLVDTKVSPEMVGLNALEIAGNKVDDNCDGRVDEPVGFGCDDSGNYVLPRNTDELTAISLLRSMGLCLEKVDQNSKKPGLISAELVMPGGMSAYLEESEGGNPGKVVFIKDVWPFNVLSDFSNDNKSHSILPKQGKSFAVLSSGDAKDVSRGVNSDEHVSYSISSKGGGLIPSEIPKEYLDAHDGKLETSAACSYRVEGIYDLVGLKLKMRVPQNVNGIGFKFRFFTREYPRYLCSKYNDFFVALLDSKAKDIPKDKNISFDKYKNPVSVNNAFFTSCVPISCPAHSCPNSMSCDDKKKECQLNKVDACSDGEVGQKDVSTYSEHYNERWGAYDRGATAWLQTKAPVVPGEEIELKFYIWDTSDSILDSTVILDDFTWEYGKVIVDTNVVN